MIERFSEQLQAIDQMRIKKSGVDGDGDPFVVLDSGNCFYGTTLLGDFQRGMYDELGASTKKVLREDCFQVAFDVVESYFGERMAYQRYYQLVPGDIVVEIGAYGGFNAASLAKNVTPEGTVIAIEADPDNFRILSKNVNANGLDHVVPLCRVVSDCSGSAKFYHSMSQGNSLKRNVLENVDSPVIGSEVEMSIVETETLEQILSSIDVVPETIDFAILTVNGAEVDVLRGMDVNLEAGINLSVAAPYSDGNGPYYKQIQRLLTNAGYETIYEDDVVYATPSKVD